MVVRVSDDVKEEFAKRVMDAVVLARLAMDESPSVREGVACNEHSPEAALVQLAYDEDDDDVLIWEALVENPRTPAEAIVVLARRDLAQEGIPDWNLRAAIAGHPNTPAAILEAFAVDEQEESVISAIIANPNTPQAVLERFLSDPDEILNVLSTPWLDATILERLATDKREMVRWHVAMHPNTPATVLGQLAKDAAEKVREGVAGNPRLPDALFGVLARDPDLGVRKTVLEHPRAPADVVAAIVRDPELKSHARTTGSLASTGPPMADTGMSIGDQSTTHVERAQLAANHDTPASLLQQLTRDSSRLVREALAANTRAPVPVLDLLGADTSYCVRERVAANAATSLETLVRLASDAEWPVRAAVAGNPSSPADLVARMATNADWLVRQGVASNPAAPFALLDRLAEDPEAPVRAAAANNPSRARVEITDGRLVVSTIPVHGDILDLSGRDIVSIADIHGLSRAMNVHDVYLTSNRLSSFVGIDQLPPNVEHVWLSANPISSLEGLESLDPRNVKVYINVIGCEGVLSALDRAGKAARVDFIDELDGLANLDKLVRYLKTSRAS